MQVRPVHRPSRARAATPAQARPELRCALTLSVVVPAYNEAATLAEVLERVIAQERVTEVLVVDDGSTDATPRSSPTSRTHRACG